METQPVAPMNRVGATFKAGPSSDCSVQTDGRMDGRTDRAAAWAGTGNDTTLDGLLAPAMQFGFIWSVWFSTDYTPHTEAVQTPNNTQTQTHAQTQKKKIKHGMKRKVKRLDKGSDDYSLLSGGRARLDGFACLTRASVFMTGRWKLDHFTQQNLGHILL